MNRHVTYRWWALGAISLAILAVTLDVTVLTLALPTLANVLKASESELQWFVTSYTLALVAGMLPAGLLGDRYGRKHLMAGSLLLFTVGSLACAYSPGPASFIAARAALGIAGAALIVMALSIITVLLKEEERSRAIGIWSIANFLGLPLGPILGGWLLSHVWWGWIFLMNVPVALIGFIAVLALVPESRASQRPDFDGLGLMLSSIGLVALMYGVIQAGNKGWLKSAAIGSIISGLIFLIIFGLWEQRVSKRGRQPLVDMGLFRSRSFTWGAILTGFGTMGLFGVMFALPQYYQAIKGLTPESTGFHLLPLVAGLIVGAAPADRMARRMGAKLTVALGFAVVILGSWLGATMTVTTGEGVISIWTFAVGAGAGLGFATAASTALTELSAERSGIGSALLQALIKLGPAFGASILGSVLNSIYKSHVAFAGLPRSAAAAVKTSVFGGIAVAHQVGSAVLLASVRTAFVAGMNRSLQLVAGMAVVAIVLAIAFLPSHKRVAGNANSPRM